MNPGSSTVLKVVGIVGLSAVAVLSSCVFALLSLCGGWTERDMVPLTLGSLVVAVAAVVGAGVLVRSARNASPATAPAARDPGVEAGALLHLRAVVAARVVLSLAVTVLWQLRSGKGDADPRFLAAALGAFVVYQLPLAYVLWAIREQLERFAVWLAVTYSLAAVAEACWALITLWRYSSAGANATFLATTLVGVTIDGGIIVTGWRARRAMPDEADVGRAMIAFVAAFAYTAVARSLTAALFTALSRVHPG
jgi:hypothetical protein